MPVYKDLQVFFPIPLTRIVLDYYDEITDRYQMVYSTLVCKQIIKKVFPVCSDRRGDSPLLSDEHMMPTARYMYILHRGTMCHSKTEINNGVDLSGNRYYAGDYDTGDDKRLHFDMKCWDRTQLKFFLSIESQLLPSVMAARLFSLDDKGKLSHVTTDEMNNYNPLRYKAGRSHKKIMICDGRVNISTDTSGTNEATFVPLLGFTTETETETKTSEPTAPASATDAPEKKI